MGKEIPCRYAGDLGSALQRGATGKAEPTGGVGLSVRGVNAACRSVLGDAGERAARLRQRLRWAARVGAGPRREKAASRWREGKEVRGLGCWASAGEEGSWARVGFGLGFQGRLGWAWVEFGSGWVLFSSFLFYSISKTNTQILIEFKFQFEFKPSTQQKEQCTSMNATSKLNL